MPYDCDVIVVGSGAGGATCAYACARAGKSVLLLERGRKLESHPIVVNDVRLEMDACRRSGDRVHPCGIVFPAVAKQPHAVSCCGPGPGDAGEGLVEQKVARASEAGLSTTYRHIDIISG